MAKPFFRVTKISGTNDEHKVEHNCEGNLGWTDVSTVNGATARLLTFAYNEGQRNRSSAIKRLLEDSQ